MSKSKLWHALALVLFVAGLSVHDLQADPTLASVLHVSGSVLASAGLIVAMVSQALFGSTTPPNPSTVGKVATKVIGSVLMLGVLAAVLGGCPGGVSPNTQNIINDSEQLGACVETTYYTESNLSPPPNALAIALACADNCGADVADLVESLIGDDSGDGGTPAAAPKAAPAGAPSRGDVVAAAKSNASIVHTHALAHRQNAKAGG